MFSKRKVMAAVTAASLVVLIVTGTFAWTSLNSQQVNEWFGAGATPGTGAGGTLHDHHKENEESKKVYVENWGDEDLFVRIKLGEYMEIGSGAGKKSAEKDSSGKDIHNPDNKSISVRGNAWNIDEPEKWTVVWSGDRLVLTGDAPTGILPWHKLSSYWEWDMGGQTSYFAAPESLRTNKNYVEQGIVGYPPGTKVSEEAKETLPATVMSMEAWKTAGSLVGNYWVIDRSDGWAYWAAPLKPGTATGLLLNKVTQDSEWATYANRGGFDYKSEYYYGINVHAQMATKDGTTANGDLDNYRSFEREGGWSDDGKQLMELIVAYATPPTEPGTHNLTLAFGTGGSIMPNYQFVTPFKAGTEISLKERVRVLPGYDFDKWISSDDTVVFSNPNSAESTFIMPGNNVTITATFKMNSSHPQYPGND